MPKKRSDKPSVLHQYFHISLYKRQGNPFAYISLHDASAFLSMAHRIPKYIQTPVIYELINLGLIKKLSKNHGNVILQVVKPKSSGTSIFFKQVGCY